MKNSMMTFPGVKNTGMTKTTSQKTGKHVYTAIDAEGTVLYKSAPTHRHYVAILLDRSLGQKDFSAANRFGRPDLIGKGDSRHLLDSAVVGLPNQEYVMAYLVDEFQVDDMPVIPEPEYFIQEDSGGSWQVIKSATGEVVKEFPVDKDEQGYPVHANYYAQKHAAKAYLDEMTSQQEEAIDPGKPMEDEDLDEEGLQGITDSGNILEDLKDQCQYIKSQAGTLCCNVALTYWLDNPVPFTLVDEDSDPSDAELVGSITAFSLKTVRFEYPEPDQCGRMTHVNVPYKDLPGNILLAVDKQIHKAVKSTEESHLVNIVRAPGGWQKLHVPDAGKSSVPGGMIYMSSKLPEPVHMTRHLTRGIRDGYIKDFSKYYVTFHYPSPDGKRTFSESVAYDDLPVNILHQVDVQISQLKGGSE